MAPTGSSPAYGRPMFTAHIWGGMPPFPLSLPAASWCTTPWGGAPRLPLPPLPRGNPTLRLPRVLTSPPWSVAPPSGKITPGPWESPRSPLSSRWRTITPTAPPPCTSLPGTAPLLPSFPAPLLPFPTASKLSADFGRPPSNRCYCRQSSALGIEKLPTVVGSPHLSETIY